MPPKRDHFTPSRTNNNFGSFQGSFSLQVNSMNIGRRPVQHMHHAFICLPWSKCLLTSSVTISVIPLQTLIIFSNTLWYILLTMQKLNPEAHRHNSKLWHPDAECGSRGRNLVVSLLLFRCTSWVTAHCKTNAEHYFHFSHFFVKASFSDFFQLNRYYCRSS